MLNSRLLTQLKQCACCGRVWVTTHRPSLCLSKWGYWDDLKLVGPQGDLELRNCLCASTLAVEVSCS